MRIDIAGLYGEKYSCLMATSQFLQRVRISLHAHECNYIL